MKKFCTVIFDLDGTLLDTLEDLSDSVNHALRLCGMPERSTEEVRTFVGNGVAKLIHLAVPGGTPMEQEAECLSVFRAHYMRNMDNRTAPYAGVLKLLDLLRGSGVKVAVVSNKFDGAVKGLCDTYFGDRIMVSIGESDGVAKKPAPDTVYRALSEMDATTEGAVYVGDSDVDILTARNSKIPCISVTWGFRSRAFLTEHGATWLVDSVAELERALLDS